KKKYLLLRTHHAKGKWRKLNTSLNDSYKADEQSALLKQMEELQVADEKGNYKTTWKIIHDISGKKRKCSPKVKKRDGSAPSGDKDLLAEWREYFCALLNNDNGLSLSDLPPPAKKDLPISTDPPTCDETRKAIQAMNSNKAAGLDWAITAEALQGGGEVTLDIIHKFCVEVFTTSAPPKQWITNIIVPLPKKGDLS
ncbi:unnamed protein product, partial [marine sediment metagenome]